MNAVRYAECGICTERVAPDTADRSDDGPLYARVLTCPAHAGAPRFSDEAKAWAERPLTHLLARSHQS